VRILRRGGSAASTLDLLVAGLGNPGREYAGTRHNIGWMVVDEVVRRQEGSWRSKFSGQLAEVRADGARLALLKPETYMNDSGRSIAAAARFFKAPIGSVLVVHDDVDLDEGRLQVRGGGGLAGHNGLRSIAQALGRGLRAVPVGARDRCGGSGRTLRRRGRDGPARGSGNRPAALQLTTLAGGGCPAAALRFAALPVRAGVRATVCRARHVGRGVVSTGRLGEDRKLK
jgi:peptidyl-tRNA hydrolase